MTKEISGLLLNMFIAIVLDKVSQAKLYASLIKLPLDLPNFSRWTLKLHHCTLAHSSSHSYKGADFKTGMRTLLATHIGYNDEAIAFKVSGADDSLNVTPHVTAFVSQSGKAKSSNLITNWQEIAPISVNGTVKFCK